MNLRKKTMLIVGASLCFLTIILCVAVPVIQKRNFEKVETSLCIQKMDGVLAAFNKSLEEFAARYKDYSQWDDTCQFIKGENAAYIESNYTESGLASINANALVILDKNGKVCFATGFDKEIGKKIELPEGFAPYIAPDSALLRHDSPDSVKTGIISLPQGNMMLTAQPVLNSQGEGDICGTFVVGRYFNAQEIDRLSCYTLTPIEVCSANAQNIPEDFKSVMASNTTETLTARREANTISGYSMIKNIGGKPAFAVRTDMSLEMFRKLERDGSISFIIAFVALGITLFLVVIGFLGRSVLSPLARLGHRLQEVADDVAAASEQMSSSSHELAAAASCQAANLEESSAPLAQLAQQAKSNSDGAGKADATMERTRGKVASAAAAMIHSVATMNAIKDSSGRISGIIKTIEEIAFQTNLLALNAAVEAARAGEQGRGFAVVAGEVRTLAQKSANAAKDTAAMIETNLEHAKKGTADVERAAEGVREIAADAAIVSADVAAIALASNEQSAGIGQINSGISQMEKVTQDVAANAKESASVSVEMSEQSQQLKSVVEDLVAMIGFSGGEKRHCKTTIAVRTEPNRTIALLE